MSHMEIADQRTTLTERFIDANRLDGRSENTLRAYSADISGYYLWMFKHPDHKRIVDLRVGIPTYLNEIRLQVKPATMKRKVSTLRLFARWALDDPTFMAKYRAPTVAAGKAHPLPNGTHDLNVMLSVTRRPHHRALLILCGRMGLRVAEALNVRVEDFSDDNGEILLTVRGKGDKTRVLPVTVDVLTDLTPAFALVTQDDSRLVPITDRSARRFITRCGAKAGIGRPVSSHDLRHTFATDLYERTMNIRVVQEFLGHSSVETTQVYTGVTMKDMRDAVSS